MPTVRIVPTVGDCEVRYLTSDAVRMTADLAQPSKALSLCLTAGVLKVTRFVRCSLANRVGALPKTEQRFSLADRRKLLHGGWVGTGLRVTTLHSQSIWLLLPFL